MFYVGPDFFHREPNRKVINALVLDQQHRPLSSHTLQFWFEDNPMRPPDVSFLQLTPENVFGEELEDDEKKMLVGALLFYFGPAQFEPPKGVAKGEMKPDDLNKQEQTGLGEESFADVHRTRLNIKLNARRDKPDTPDKNPNRLPSYVLNEADNTCSFYVGPDFDAGDTTVKVITPIVPNQKHLLKFKAKDFQSQDATTGLPELRPNDVVGDLDPDEENMLLGVLQFYFEPANYLKAVSKDKDFGPLEFYFRSDQWKWWLAVVDVVANAPAPSEEGRAPDQLKLCAIKLENLLDERGTKGKPSYYLYEAQNKLMFYVGPDFEHGRSDITVINTVVLSPESEPQSSHTSYFGFLDRGPHEVSKGLDGSFLDELKARDVVGPPSLGESEKEMLLSALRFYFVPATKFWNAVTNDNLKPEHLNGANKENRKRGGRYEILEQQTGLGPGYFDRPRRGSYPVKLYAARDTTPPDQPSYFLYEAQSNLTFYVGPDFFHREPNRKVINAMVLNEEHGPLESHTLDFSHTLDLRPFNR